jgi:hypothetical protein
VLDETAEGLRPRLFHRRARAQRFRRLGRIRPPYVFFRTRAVVDGSGVDEDFVRRFNRTVEGELGGSKLAARAMLRLNDCRQIPAGGCATTTESRRIRVIATRERRLFYAIKPCLTRRERLSKMLKYRTLSLSKPSGIVDRDRKSDLSLRT